MYCMVSSLVCVCYPCVQYVQLTVTVSTYHHAIYMAYHIICLVRY
jgi:hypothetical protein